MAEGETRSPDYLDERIMADLAAQNISEMDNEYREVKKTRCMRNQESSICDKRTVSEKRKSSADCNLNWNKRKRNINSNDTNLITPKNLYIVFFMDGHKNSAKKDEKNLNQFCSNSFITIPADISEGDSEKPGDTVDYSVILENALKISSSKLLEECQALLEKVKKHPYPESEQKKIIQALEAKDRDIKSLLKEVDKYQTNRYFKILSHVIYEAEKCGSGEKSSASAIIQILKLYAEEKKLFTFNK